MPRKPRICITGSEREPARLRSRLETVLAQHPELLCELRLDWLGLNPEDAFRYLESLPDPWCRRLVPTLRHRQSGAEAQGQCDWEIPLWKNWWKKTLAAREWFAADLDWSILDAQSREDFCGISKGASTALFFSHHASLWEIENVGREMAAYAAEKHIGIKLAAPVASAPDLARFAAFSAQVPETPLAIFVAMGSAGRAWRWSHLAGSLSYFAYDDSAPTAPGQGNWRDALPFLEADACPDLYVLWCSDPNNFYGETRWNGIFSKRAWNARYLALACADPGDIGAAEKQVWARAALEWMDRAGVCGASITNPFKTYFQNEAACRGLSSINTIARDGSTWKFANTDGSAVHSLLAQAGQEKAPVLVIGSGGASKGVAEEWKRMEYPCEIWRRDATGKLPKLAQAEVPARALVNTWPAPYQDELVAALLENFNAETQPALILDAQLRLDENQAPLAKYCQQRGIAYIPGKAWWSRQARGQAAQWRTREQDDAFFAKIESYLPHSKSETIRAMALAAFCGVRTRLENPSICADTEYFAQALEKFGTKVLRSPGAWQIIPTERMQMPKSPVFLGESATVLRFLAAGASLLPAGNTLVLQCAPSLQKRTLQPILETLRISWDGNWPLRIPTGLPLPKQASLTQTSQVASGVLLAAAAELMLANSESAEFSLAIEGIPRSLPYLRLTGASLKQAGFRVGIHEKSIGLAWPRQGETAAIARSSGWNFSIARDASGLAFLELILQFLGAPGITSWLLRKNEADAPSEQGDFAFFQFLAELRSQSHLRISLADNPDLAPCLWAAALLFQRDLTVHSTPQLHDKECDRALALVEAAHELGFHAENRADGFFVAASRLLPRKKGAPRPASPLRTHHDHRIAMAFGCLQLAWPEIQLDDLDCVEKSFPAFWDCHKFIRETFP